MADASAENQERHCHDLLMKLKKTTESLLVGQSAQGPWGTYGALRRVCVDTEAILCHRIKAAHGKSKPTSSFWQFANTAPNTAPSSALSSAPTLGAIQEKFSGQDSAATWLSESVHDHTLMVQLEALIADRGHLHAWYHVWCVWWLRELVHDHTLMVQLEALIADRGHLHAWYHDDAFLCQPDYVKAMKICFRAIELNKPALLVDINPHLLRAGQSDPRRTGQTDPRRTGQTDPRRLSVEGKTKHPPGSSYTSREATHDNIMGNRNSHLNVHYSSMMSNSNLSLSVDPSLGASSLVQQKILSGPYFVNSLDSPGLLENLRSHDPLSDAMRNIQHSNTFHRLHSRVDPDHTLDQTHTSVTVQQNNQINLTAMRNKSEQLSSKDNCEDAAVDILQLRIDEPASSDVRKQSLEEQSDQMDSSMSSSHCGCQCSDGLHHPHCRGLPHEQNTAEDFNESGYHGNSESFLVRSTDSCFSVKSQPSLSMDFSPCSSYQMHDNSFGVAPKCDSVNSASLESSTEVDETDGGLKFKFSSVFKSRGSGVLENSGAWGGSRLADSFKHCTSSSELNSFSINSDTSLLRANSVKSDPAINVSEQLIPRRRASRGNQFCDWQLDKPSSNPASPRPWAEVDLYNMSSPGTSPFTKPGRSSGQVYVPEQPGTAGSLDRNMSASGKPEEADTPHGAGPAVTNPSNGTLKLEAVPPVSRRLGHKRWVSDTSALRIEEPHAATPVGRRQPLSSSESSHQTCMRASGWDSYQGTLTKPVEGQSLMSYLSSQDFNTCANLEKENAHFHISEALIAAFEAMKWSRMMKKQATGRQTSSSSSSSSDEEIHELRQRIRIRKREKMLAKGRPFPSLSSDGQTENDSNCQVMSSADHDISSSSGSSTSDDDDDDRNIDLNMSSDSHGNLAELRSSGLALSMASLYSEVELARSNQQIVKISNFEESTNPGSAESIAISLLKKFSEKHLPKASELKWLVSERDAPQSLLPLPSSIPISPDDVNSTVLATPNRTRLRGNMEWAPPRAQIIFSVHPPEKQSVVMSRQNFRCAGCGLRVDPALMKRYKYCEYLGKYFCQCCHTGETSIIPGHVLERWHFNRYPVATFSYTLLEKMWAEPLFHVDTINPSLYRRVRGLENIRECRQQLVHLQSLLGVCKRDPKILKEMRRLPSHWISNDDAYSMDDFVKVKTGAMLSHIKAFISLALSHVEDCQLCQGLGFICGMCHDPKVIFPFQLESVVSCQVCQSCYHKGCFVPDKCPKCIRMEARIFDTISLQLRPVHNKFKRVKKKFILAIQKKLAFRNRWIFHRRESQTEVAVEFTV
ncbi:run domain Beclin-1-interacting and cysteine-rich domain-containing protein-like [Physella acuta]|uniref:run domain Beclin-1-interacting and cysteine-rich domain-containing protein-like n=1 Tax=Physella acuta TaxID=109671 RepID=UPI0027DD31A9|nr:run domain Beclin-1-interacting and cysteine-rich domain-containing protein-like [Physella acuta]